MADIKDFKHAIVRQKILDAVRKDLIDQLLYVKNLMKYQRTVI